MRVWRWLPAAISALALLLGAANAFALWRLGGRLTAFERGLEAVKAARASGEAPAPARVGKLDPGLVRAAADGPLDVHDPEVQEQIALLVEANDHRRDQERKQRMRDTIREAVAIYAEKEGLDGRTIDRVLDELDRRSEAFDLTREDVRSGALSWADARVEFEELRAASDAELSAILGERRFEELTDKLWSGMGPGGGPGLGGPGLGGGPGPR